MAVSSVDKSILKILSQKFFILFPPDYFLSWLLFIAIVLVLIYLYLIPKRIHDEAIVKLEKKLDVDLKLLENNLNAKLDHLNIIRTQVEPKKIEAYTKFSDTFGDMFADPESLMKGIKSGKTKQPEMKKLWYDLGAKLFFFASDNTIKKYIELRSHTADQSNFTQGQLTDPMVPIRLYSEIIFSMRKDLGYEDTTANTT